MRMQLVEELAIKTQIRVFQQLRTLGTQGRIANAVEHQPLFGMVIIACGGIFTADDAYHRVCCVPAVCSLTSWFLTLHLCRF